MSAERRMSRSAELVLHGHGARSWRAIESALGPRPAGFAWSLREADVVGRIRPLLPSGAEPAKRAALAVLAQMQAALNQGFAVAGYVSYDLGAALEGVAPCAVGDASRAAELVVFRPQALELTKLPVLTSDGGRPDAAFDALTDGAVPASLAAEQQAFERNVHAVVERIAAGDVYQVNVTTRFDVAVSAAVANLPALTLAAAQQLVQQVPYGFVHRRRGVTLVSGSMERFVSVLDGVARSRPIKGTVARGRSLRADHAARDLLLGSEKERAENTMIVDMARNDLARVATTGSVVVEELLRAVAYRTVWHLESEVRAALEPGMEVQQVLAALMPPASVSGCPKIAAMRLISALERRRRGAYCGALGIALPSGEQDWSVGIRALTMRENCARIDVGAGIVADSKPRAEWREVSVKARSALALLAVAKHLTRGPAAAHGHATMLGRNA